MSKKRSEHDLITIINDEQLTDKVRRKALTGLRLRRAINFKYGEKRGAQSALVTSLQLKGYPCQKASISQYCNGHQQFSNEFAVKAAEILGVKTEYLLGLSDYPTDDYLTDKEKELNRRYKEAVAKSIKKKREFRYIIQSFIESAEAREIDLIFYYSVEDSPEVSACLVYQQNEYVLCDPDNKQWQVVFPCEAIINSISFSNYEGASLFLEDGNIIDGQTPEDITEFELSHVYITTSAGSAELTVNNFLKMLCDIEDSRERIIKDRCNFWIKYNDYDYFKGIID